MSEDTGTVRWVELATATLDVDAVVAAVVDPAAGAVVSFAGTVRDHDHGRAVVALTYEAHPSAGDVLTEIAREVATMPGVVGVALAHRAGDLAVGATALLAAVSAHHRDQAFACCSRLVEDTKQRLPVWKHQVFADGSDEWVNCP